VNSHPIAEFGDLRSYLRFLDNTGRLKRVHTPVQKDWEIACVSRLAIESARQNAYAILFERVRDYTTSVLVNAYATDEMYAAALGMQLSSIFERWARALANPRKPACTDRAPVHEEIEIGSQADLLSIPAPVWTPGRDAGPYISAGNVITKDPDSGIQNLANYRVQVHDSHRAGLFFGSRFQHGAMHYEKYSRRGKPMPVAIVIGVAPAINFAAAAKTAYGVDELEIAGSLAGAPVEVVRARTVDLLVPATAECVIEGLVSPDEREIEGPFGEALGYVNWAALAPVVNVTAITHRHSPIHHGYVQQLPPSEGHVVMRMGFLGPLWYYLTSKLRIDDLLDIAIPAGCAGVSILYVRLKRSHTMQPSAIGRVLAKLNFGQKAIALFDEDIDIHDEEACAWALSSRVDPEHDIEVIPNTRTFQYDPSTLARAGRSDTPPYESSMMIVNATVKSEVPEASLPAATFMEKAVAIWETYGLPALTSRGRLQILLAAQSNNTEAGAPATKSPLTIE
jgi:UbiD family decarboxylase